MPEYKYLPEIDIEEFIAHVLSNERGPKTGSGTFIVLARDEYVNEINRGLQAGFRENLVKVGKRRFGVGDPVCVTKNFPLQDIHNGSRGIVESIDETRETVSVKFEGMSEQVVFPFEDNVGKRPYCGDLTLAYAITIQKSQGSTWEKVYLYGGGATHWTLNSAYTVTTRSNRDLCITALSPRVEKGFSELWKCHIEGNVSSAGKSYINSWVTS